VLYPLSYGGWGRPRRYQSRQAVPPARSWDRYGGRTVVDVSRSRSRNGGFPGSLRDDPDAECAPIADNGKGRVRPGRKVMTMATGTKYLLGYAAAAIVAFILLPNWIALLLIVGIPVGAYLMLDPSQRRRLKRAGRRELGR
jgi:hypothetical protein